MSKTIDLNDPQSWSEDDIVYLRDRGKLPSGYKLSSDLEISPPQGRKLEDVPNLGDVGTYPEPGSVGSDEAPIGAFVDEPFEDMSKARLQAEARARGLDDSGNKSDL